MPDEVSRALGMEGGGFQVLVRDREAMVEKLQAKGHDGAMFAKMVERGEGDQKELVHEISDAQLVEMLGDERVEATVTLSDCSKLIQSRHVCWLKGRLRQGKLDQKAQGIITSQQCEAELQAIDHRFDFGDYNFGKPAWLDCLQIPECLGKFYLLLLEEHHPETKSWTFDDIDALVNMNPKGFDLALRDILPKAMKELEEAQAKVRTAAKAKVRASLLSKSAQS